MGSTLDPQQRQGNPAPATHATLVADHGPEGEQEILFVHHPVPMLLCEPGSFRILAANQAAAELYRYRRAELECMTIGDLAATLREREAFSQALLRNLGRSGPWRHRRGDGSVIEVEIRGSELSHRGSAALLLSVLDVGRQLSAERGLEERTAYLHALFEHSPLAIVALDNQGRVRLCNRAFERLFGYSEEEICGQVLDDVIAPGPLNLQARNLTEQARQGPIHLTAVRKRRDGRAVDVEVYGLPLLVADELRGAFALYDDITERRRTELEREVMYEVTRALTVTSNLKELLQSIHQLLRRAVYAENCFVALYEASTDSFTFPLFVSQRDPVPSTLPLAKIQRSATALVFRSGQPLLLTPPEVRRLVEAQVIELVGEPSAAWLGVPLKTAQGTIGVLVVQHFEDPNAYSQRDVALLNSVGTHIALAIERRQAELALRESEAQLRLLLEQLPAILWTTDTNLRFTSSLGAGLKALGLTPGQAVGQTLADFFQTDDPEFPSLAAHRRALAGETVSYELQWNKRLFQSHVEPLRNERGEIVGVIGIAVDCTDRYQLELQLHQSQKMEAIGRLAGGVAHDFNNLLTVIRGYAELLAQKGLPDAESGELCAEIQKAAERAASLTRQLLAFSRQQMRRPTVLDLNVVVSELEPMLQRLIGEDIELRTLCDPQLESILADRSQIEQVILNLVVNARDAMPQGGKLLIETANVRLDESYCERHLNMRAGRYVLLAVTDTGCGMDAATRERIFEPFFTTKKTGSGLGLATVYGIVHQSHGHIVVYSEPGKGTSMKIYFPALLRPAAPPPETASRPAPRGTETILLVEDEAGVRSLARRFLEQAGYRVLEASNPTEAWQIATEFSGTIDLLVTDVVMPGGSGRELADRMQNCRPNLRVLFMSGYTDDAIVHHGVLCSKAHLLEKPFHRDDLLRKVRSILDYPPTQHLPSPPTPNEPQVDR